MISRFCRTVMRKGKLRWGMYPTAVPGGVTRLPPSGGSIPASTRARVDLPEPLAPSTAQTRPGSREKPGISSTVRRR